MIFLVTKVNGKGRERKKIKCHVFDFSVSEILIFVIFYYVIIVFNLANN